MPPFTRENKPTADKTIPQEEIFGVDREEMQFVNGVSSPGWVRRREIGNGRVVHETLVSMVTPPGDQGGADDDFFPNDPSRVLINDLSALGVDVVAALNARFGITPWLDYYLGVWNDQRCVTTDGGLHCRNGDVVTDFLPGYASDWGGKTTWSATAEGVLPSSALQILYFFNVLDGDQNNGWGFFLYANGSCGVYSYLAPDYAEYNTAAGTLVPGYPFRVGVVVNGTSVRFWTCAWDESTQGFAAPVEQVSMQEVDPMLPLFNLPEAQGYSGNQAGTFAVNGRVKVWNTALSEAAMLAEMSRTADTPAQVDYRWRQPTPFASSGTLSGYDFVGNIEDNTLIVSDDWRWPLISGNGANIETLGEIPAVEFDGFSSLRSQTLHGLGALDGPLGVAYVGTAPAEAGALRLAVSLSNGTDNALRIGIDPDNLIFASVTASDTTVDISRNPGVRSFVARRTSATTGVTSLRDGLGVVEFGNETPATDSPVNRITLGGNAANNPGQLADYKVTLLLILGGITDENATAVEELIAAWAEQYVGATV